MKSYMLIPLLLLVGCGQKSPYDITPDQVSKRKVQVVHGGIDPEHLPPGAKREVKVFHKGDTLPDGTVAKGDVKMVRVTVEGPGPGQRNENVNIQKDGPP